MVDKKRRISNKDMETVAEYIKEERRRRAKTTHRSEHEKIWREVDRQVSMKPEGWDQNDPREQWEPNIELGSLADASEIIADDVLRIAFPSDRDWFRPHVNISEELEMDSNTGMLKVDAERQNLRDNIYKSMISQQHSDFGLKHRVKLSVKEALHHGSFVAVVDWRSQKQFYGSGIKEVSAPVWVPHSMWNCYPDDSPYIVGTNMTYEGAMIIEEEIPLQIVMRQPWMNLEKVKDKASKNKPNIKLLYWYGDIYIKRASDDGIFIPNQKVIVCENWVLHTETNTTSSPPILYAGYERDDVRDPYYSSPLIKRSPTHKLATHCANKYIEAIDLRTKPPLGYDANEPAFRGDGGPRIAPGETYALRSGGAMAPIEVADPSWALQGLQLFKAEVEEGTGVDSVRKGASAPIEQTAYEVSKLDQKSEIRTIDFVSTLELQGLKPFLYLQHEWNKRKLQTYSFYNSQLNTPDFITVTGADIRRLAAECHFEVIGSKGVLGEERRRQGSLEVTGFFASTPGFAERLNQKEIMQDAYRDVGVKDPERYFNFDDSEDPQLAIVKQQAQEAVAELQTQLQSATLKAAEIPLMKRQQEADLAKLVAEKSVLASENKLLEEQLQLQTKKNAAEMQLLALRERIINELRGAHEKVASAHQKMVMDGAKSAEASSRASTENIAGISELLAKERELTAGMLEFLNTEKTVRESRDEKIKEFIRSQGSPEAQDLINGI